MKPIKLSLTAREYRVDPWSEFARIRKHGAVIPMKSLMFGKFWGATTYDAANQVLRNDELFVRDPANACLLYTSPSPRDATLSRMPSSA